MRILTNIAIVAYKLHAGFFAFAMIFFFWRVNGGQLFPSQAPTPMEYWVAPDQQTFWIFFGLSCVSFVIAMLAMVLKPIVTAYRAFANLCQIYRKIQQ